MLRSGSTAFGVGAEFLFLMSPNGRYLGDGLAPLAGKLVLPHLYGPRLRPGRLSATGANGDTLVHRRLSGLGITR